MANTTLQTLQPDDPDTEVARGSFSKYTDGPPVVVPTEERVEEMLKGPSPSKERGTNNELDCQCIML